MTSGTDLEKFGPYAFTGLVSGAIELQVPSKVVDKSGIDRDRSVRYIPYKNGIHVVACKEVLVDRGVGPLGYHVRNLHRETDLAKESIETSSLDGMLLETFENYLDSINRNVEALSRMLEIYNNEGGGDDGGPPPSIANEQPEDVPMIIRRGPTGETVHGPDPVAFQVACAMEVPDGDE